MLHSREGDFTGSASRQVMQGEQAAGSGQQKGGGERKTADIRSLAASCDKPARGYATQSDLSGL